MKSDEHLQELVRQTILQDDRLSQQPIEISVTDGVATLRGCVQSYGRRLAAAEIAASIDGISGVVDQMLVEPPGQLADEQIAELVRAALEARADVARATIAVAVNNGVVKLTGTVSNHWERLLAEDASLGTKGVSSVKNLLLVDVESQVEDGSLSREIQQTLNYTRGLRGTNVRVSVTGDTAVLSGTVRQLWQKETAEAVLRRFRINNVQNRIHVAG